MNKICHLLTKYLIKKLTKNWLNTDYKIDSNYVKKTSVKTLLKKDGVKTLLNKSTLPLFKIKVD